MRRDLLGCALLLDTRPRGLPEEGSLRSLGERLFAEIWRDLSGSAPIGPSSTPRLLGAAHGWAGILYALLRWSESAGQRSPDGLDERLDQLAAHGTPIGSGLRWPAAVGPHRQGSGLWASWCNGAAGFVHLWTLAHRHGGEER